MLYLNVTLTKAAFFSLDIHICGSIQTRTSHFYTSCVWTRINGNNSCCAIPSSIWRALSSSVQACMSTCEDYLHGVMKFNQLRYKIDGINVGIRTSVVRKVLGSCLERRLPTQ